MTALAIVLASLSLHGAPTPTRSDAAPADSSVGLLIPSAFEGQPEPRFQLEQSDKTIADDQAWPRISLPASLPEPTGRRGIRGCSAAAGIILEKEHPVIGDHGVIDASFGPTQDVSAAKCGLSDLIKAATRR